MIALLLILRVIVFKKIMLYFYYYNEIPQFINMVLCMQKTFLLITKRSLIILKNTGADSALGSGPTYIP